MREASGGMLAGAIIAGIGNQLVEQGRVDARGHGKDHRPRK
jgi:hypothetical protein